MRDRERRLSSCRPLDPNLANGGGVICGDSLVDSASWSWGRHWWGWWPVCPAQETRPSVVTFSYLSLRAGTSSVTIRAVAATAGSFVLPPVRAWAEGQPELMGMTAGAAFRVCAGCAGPSFAPPAPPPKPCPSDCSGNGVCNLRTGRCTCNAGWAGRDCLRPA